MRLLSRLSLLLCFALPAAAQTYVASKIVFSDPGPYSQSQLEAVSGIHQGTSFDANELGNAAQRLLDTGYFENVGATLAGRVTAATVLFDTKPVDRTEMLPVGFHNFVWLKHDEIEAVLRAKSPLFVDYLPENSPLCDTFDAALTDALATKGITAKVTHETIEPTMLRPERSIEFRVSSPEIRVSNVKLSGVTPELVPLIQKSVNAAAKAPYSEGRSGQTTIDRILAPLFDAGYIDASLSSVSVASSSSGDTASVVISATLNPGDIYHVSGLTYAGTPLVSADAFTAAEKIHAGDVASRARLLETLAPLDDAYRRQGYMDLIVKAEPKHDRATHQVAYAISVTPGQQYRVHQVTENNLDPAAKTDFDHSFALKEGDLYNPGYIQDYLKKNTAIRSLESYTGTYKAYADPNTHTVDVVLTFLPGTNTNVIAQP